MALTVRPDDEVYQFDTVWLGPDEYTLPIQARYVAWGTWLACFLVAAVVLIPIGGGGPAGVLGSLIWSLGLSVVLSRAVMLVVDHERPLRSLPALFSAEARAALQARRRSERSLLIRPGKIRVRETPPKVLAMRERQRTRAAAKGTRGAAKAARAPEPEVVLEPVLEAEGPAWTQDVPVDEWYTEPAPAWSIASDERYEARTVAGDDEVHGFVRAPDPEQAAPVRPAAPARQPVAARTGSASAPASRPARAPAAPRTGSPARPAQPAAAAAQSGRSAQQTQGRPAPQAASAARPAEPAPAAAHGDDPAQGRLATQRGPATRPAGQNGRPVQAGSGARPVQPTPAAAQNGNPAQARPATQLGAATRQVQNGPAGSGPGRPPAQDGPAGSGPGRPPAQDGPAQDGPAQDGPAQNGPAQNGGPAQAGTPVPVAAQSGSPESVQRTGGGPFRVDPHEAETTTYQGPVTVRPTSGRHAKPAKDEPADPHAALEARILLPARKDR